MRKVSNSDGYLLFNIREEWALVIDLEVEDTMLIREFEGRRVGRGGAARVSCYEGATVEW